MDTEYGKLTVFFEKPFWVGVFERVSNGKLSICKVTFGAEPKDYEVWEFVLKHYDKLAFSSAIESEMKRPQINQNEDSAKRGSRYVLPALERSPNKRCRCSGRK